MVLKNDQTVVSAFRRQAAARAESVALWGRGRDGWRSWSWKQWEERARQAAAAFVQLGVESGDRVALLLGTRPEWAVLEQGILQAGGIVCSLYPANPLERTCFMLEDAGARVAVCEGASRARELLQQRARLPRLEHVICFEPEPEPGERSEDAVLAGACWRKESSVRISLPQLFALGEQRLPELRPELERRERELHPAGWASLYYTSGTTRVPKGVRLSHTNLLYSSQACADAMRRECAILEPGSILLVAAPLAHLLGRMNLGLIYQDGASAALESDPARLVQSCAELGASYFAAPPLVHERLHARLAGAGPRALHAELGGSARCLGCAGAGLAPHITQWFWDAGLPLIENYGATEVGIASMGQLEGMRIGSVGRPPPGTRLRVAPDGELWINGPGVMLGYHNRPEDDAEAFELWEGERWFGSGDIGHIDADGYVWIRGRKNELFKSSSAGWISPSHLEAQLKQACPLIARAFAVGAGRPHVVALLALEPGLLASDERAVLAELRRDIAALNARLSPHERIQRFSVLEAGFEKDEFTELGKPRRAVTLERHAARIDALYAEHDGFAPQAVEPAA